MDLNVWTGVGFALNLAGTALAASALVSGWQEHGRGRPIPVVTAVGVWVRTKVLRRHRETQLLHVSTTRSIRSGAAGKSHIEPAADAPTERQITYLRESVQELREQLSVQRREQRQEAATLASNIATGRSELDTRISTLGDRVTDLAVGTTWRQLLGLFLIGVGSLVSLFG